MNAKILDGRKIFSVFKEDIKKRILTIKQTIGADIRIVNILVGCDAGARSYANVQKKTAEEVGIVYELQEFPADITAAELLKALRELWQDSGITGVMIHKPLPKHINEQYIFNHIEPLKDIEGVNAVNIGNVVLGRNHLIIPCTAAAVMEHLKAAEISLRGKDVVIIGASAIVGKPLALLLLNEMATVTVCHIATTEAGRLEDHVARGDIVISAAGKPGLINGRMIKKGAVVIDVATNFVDGKMVGDVDFDSVAAKASMITPVPGGVGPVTVMMLMRNAVEAFWLQHCEEEEA
ncbi:MAG: bifunctional 5,10-methylenetetrahydrofolate dehydrogenase/5,10-methenyltetrahydrofolate cyclohydrolase [Candidatus Omnitrophota bacterium]